MNNRKQLSLEQQFSLRSFETQVQQMSQAQAQDFLVQLYQQMMVQENLYKDLIKEWGIGSPTLL